MRSKAGAVVLSAAFIVAMCASASADPGDGAIEMLEGGSLTSELRMSLGFLFGSGSAPDGLGAPVSTVGGGLGSVGGNPAGLAYLPVDTVVMDILPPFGTLNTSFVDFNFIAEAAFEGVVEEYSAPGFVPAYPTFSTELGQPGGVVSGAVGVRLGDVVVAASVGEPVSVALEMLDTGIEFFGQANEEVGSELIDVQVRSTSDAAAELAFHVSKVTLAAATDVRPDVAVGLSVSRYHAKAAVSGRARADGTVTYAGQEYAFNDPDDPWDNELGLDSEGTYEGGAFGWQVGASWRPVELVTVDATYAAMPTLVLSGSLTAVSRMMVGVVDGQLEPGLIDPERPTLTEREETVEGDPVTLRFSSYGGLAVSLHTPVVLATLEYRRYAGSFGFKYKELSEGVDISGGFGTELDFGALRLGGGIMFGRLVGDSMDAGDEGDPVIIPTTNVGFGIDIGENMRVDAMVLAVPLQVLRLSLGYEF